MYFMSIPIVYPQRWEWAAMLIFIGLSGFLAQVGEVSGHFNANLQLKASDRL